MLHLTLRRRRRWLILPALPLAIWLLAKATGLYLERAHRREFLADLGIVPTRYALSSDSTLNLVVREAVLPHVPLGSDTLTIQAYAQRIGALDHLAHVSDALGRPNGLNTHLWVELPERVRWYEFGLCDWTRVLDFSLDSIGTVRDISATSVGRCI